MMNNRLKTRFESLRRQGVESPHPDEETDQMDPPDRDRRLGLVAAYLAYGFGVKEIGRRLGVGREAARDMIGWVGDAYGRPEAA